MVYSMKGGAWAQPTQASINKTYKNTKTFGLVQPMKKAKATTKKAKKGAFNPAKFEKAKKKVFGMK